MDVERATPTPTRSVAQRFGMAAVLVMTNMTFGLDLNRISQCSYALGFTASTGDAVSLREALTCRRCMAQLAKAQQGPVGEG